VWTRIPTKSIFRSIKKFLVGRVLPVSKNEENARKEFILNILLVGFIVLGFIASFSAAMTLSIAIKRQYVYQGLPGEIVGAITLFFLALYFFSRTGKSKLIAYIFIGFCFFCAIYTSFSWGADVPQSLLTYALVIVMAGILVGTQFAFVITAVISIALVGLSYLQTEHVVIVNSLWKNKMLNIGDTIVSVVTLVIIALVSWLSNREIEKALQRVRTSEKALQKERDLLEIKVEKRTQELQKIQLEKVMQIYRFADFGKLAAGLFHDLVTPLNVVSLNLENLKEETIHDRSKNIKEIRRVLRRAIYSTSGIEKFVKNTRAQLQDQQTKSYFNLAQEISNALEGLADKASKTQVKLDFNDRNAIHTFGNSFRFHQMVVNLVSNAIDSYTKVGRKSNRIIYIRLFLRDSFITLEVEDFGIGVPRHVLPHIFDPFYTTKSNEQGIGIGLTICKDIVEKDFGGKITVKSKPKKGTIFRVQFPKRKLNAKP
jgi:signal transduction histidine kinase